ncbi:MAG: acyltransferase family protein [Pseudomonadota bacterium]
MTVTAAPSPAHHTPHLDGLRIVAAGAIVVLHYAEYCRGNPIANAAFNHIQHFNLLVDLFFVISGFVIASQYATTVADRRSIARFLWRRLARIYPLHLATLAFYLLIAAAIQLGIAKGDNPARYPLSDIPAQLLLLHAIIGERLTFNFPSWSISAEMVCYIAFPLLSALALRRRALAVWAFAAMIASISIGAIAAGSGPWTEWINHGGAARALPSFLLGIVLYRYQDVIGSRPALKPPMTPVLLIFVAAGSALPATAQLMLVYAIVILALRLDLTRRRSAFTWFGFERWSDYTYSIYMLHVPVATIVLSIFGRYAPIDKLALAPLAVLMLAGASYLSCRFFETPLRYALYNLVERRRATGPAPAFVPRSGAR